MKEKDKYFNTGMFLFVVPCAVAILAAIICSVNHQNNKTDKYIITGKGANKIEYRSINDADDIHVMTFDADTGKMAPGWYPYINIGDTIMGKQEFMARPVCGSLYNYKWGAASAIQSVIQLANGKSLNELRELARRDSLLREIKSHTR